MGEPHGGFRHRPTIGLAMIVRNEAAVIERCLASVAGVIDTWTIVDTGSVDDTVEVTRAALAGVPGTLHERPWVDFGTNRTELMTLARGTADHLLLLDADMTLRVEGSFPILEDRDYLLTHAGGLAYRIPRLVRGDRSWRYVGATHEYLTSDEAGPVTTVLEGVWVDHHADGGSRGDKFERDRRLLERAVAADPDDDRSVFYLAQTRADLGDTETAIDLYRRRVALGGWDEERFCAQLRIGELSVDTDWPGAVTALLAAHELRPSRAEPLYHLARGHRIRGAHASAALFARAGLAIPFPDDDVLFVQREPYDWGLAFELSIATYWTGDVGESLALSEALLDGGIPEWLVPWVVHNRDAAVARIAEVGTEASASAAGRAGSTADATGAGSGLGAVPLLATRVEGVRFTRLAPAPDDPDAEWSLFNPCVTNGPDGLGLVLRRSNYVRDAQGHYFTRDSSPQIRTRNRFRLFDTDGDVVAEHALVESPDGPPVFDSPVLGVEDLRAVWHAGRWVGFGVCRDRNAGALNEMVLWELGADGRGTGPLQVLHHDPAANGDGAPGFRGSGGDAAWAGWEDHEARHHEKNWMPFVDGDELFVVYSCEPLVVLGVDVDSGRTRVVSRSRSAVSGASSGVPNWTRGGSQGCGVAPGRWRFVIHEVFGARDAERTYVHRFVDVAGEATEGFRVVAASPRFGFTGAKIEFAAGLALDGDDLVVSFGVNDAQGLLARMPVTAVDDWMQPVPHA